MTRLISLHSLFQFICFSGSKWPLESKAPGSGGAVVCVEGENSGRNFTSELDMGLARVLGQPSAFSGDGKVVGSAKGLAHRNLGTTKMKDDTILWVLPIPLGAQETNKEPKGWAFLF